MVFAGGILVLKDEVIHINRRHFLRVDEFRLLCRGIGG